MAHNSIHPANVIVDEHYNIQGYVSKVPTVIDMLGGIANK